MAQGFTIWYDLKEPLLKAKVDDTVNLLPLRPVVVTSPFSQLDWQRPAKLRDNGQFDFNYPNYPATAPFKQSDWPRPWRLKLTIAADAPANLLPLRAVVTTAPFSQRDWLPVSKSKSTVKPDVSVNLLPLRSPAVVAQPFSQRDWPTAAKRGDTNQEDFSFIQAPTAVAGTPFSQRDWLTSPRRRGVEQTDFNSPIYPFSLPFNPTEWPKVNKLKNAKAADAPANLLPLRPVIVAQPFSQNNWSNSVGRRKATGEVYSQFLTPPKPFSQNDWLRPSVKLKSLRVDTVELLLPFFGTRPFLNLDTNRTFVRQVVKSDIFVNLLPLHAVLGVGVPFSFFDWANPVIKASSSQARVSPITPGPPIPPRPRVNEWLNRARRRHRR